MSIKHELTVAKYEAIRHDILAALANLREFTNPLPLHYGHIGSLEDLRERLLEATACAETYPKA